MNTGVFVTLIVIGGVVWGEVLSCDSCGRECAAACGTRQFRTCCFNYLRKRTPLESFAMDPSLRVELWLARSRGIRNTPRIAQTQLENDDDMQNYDYLKDVNLLIRNPKETNNEKSDEPSYNMHSNM